MVDDASWRRTASRLLSTVLSTPEDGLASLASSGQLEAIAGAKPSADDLRHARRILVLVAEALCAQATDRHASLELAARTLDGGPTPRAAESPTSEARVLPSYLRDGMHAAPAVVVSVVAPAAPPPVVPPPKQPAVLAGATVDLAEATAGIDFDQMSGLPFQSTSRSDAPPASAPSELDDYAATVAELAAKPERRAAILVSRGYSTEDAFLAAARSWQQRFATDPTLRQSFERAVAAHKAR